jgi:2,3-dihydroxybiphenyl 1,2-dioxygenase
MVTQLGYLAFEVSDLAVWERFGIDVLGLDVSGRRDDGGFSLRMDSRKSRFFIEPGPGDDLAAIGWDAGDEANLAATVARLRGAGIDVVEGNAATRGVQRLFKLRDPGGIPTEIFVGAERASEPFQSKKVRTGFVAEELGLGHLVVSAPDRAASDAFYTGLLGFRLSDRIVTEFFGHKVDLSFFHANARHHSIAFGDAQKKRLHHFMLEVHTIDDVGLAMDRTMRAGLRIMQTLGRHPNDGMFSFYAKTPSGFQFEFGHGGRIVDDATWTPTTYDRISEWGHHPPIAFQPPQQGQHGTEKKR